MNCQNTQYVNIANCHSMYKLTAKCVNIMNWKSQYHFVLMWNSKIHNKDSTGTQRNMLYEKIQTRVLLIVVTGMGWNLFSITSRSLVLVFFHIFHLL
jgi:hypothetical protein